jgi:DivIVA domain-containing protein
MPTSDLDMPLLPSAEQIRKREFATVRRGYDPQQVRAYLTSIANQVGSLEAGSTGARSEQAADQAVTPAPVSTEDPYEALARRFAGLIEIADQEADRVLENARSEAAQVLDQATSEADRIRVDAQAHAEEARQKGSDLLEHARTESDRVIAGLADRRRNLVDQLEQMRGKLISVAEDLAVPLEEASRLDAEDATVAETSARTEASGDDAEADSQVDPRYEDLWLSKDESLQIPDLASIDLELEEGDE